jgi:hypothetical protein
MKREYGMREDAIGLCWPSGQDTGNFAGWFFDTHDCVTRIHLIELICCPSTICVCVSTPIVTCPRCFEHMVPTWYIARLQLCLVSRGRQFLSMGLHSIIHNSPRFKTTLASRRSLMLQNYCITVQAPETFVVICP